jgi:hypothetical protein
VNEIVAVLVVGEGEPDSEVQLPSAPFVKVALELKQNVFVVAAPFGVTWPFRVADVDPIDDAAPVLIVDRIAGIVKL